MYGAKSTSKIKILYGGSVDESNARMMLEEGGVQGLLVGRASLKPKQFIKLIEATAFYNENNKTNW
jgi:triosephosphate isomerase